MENPPITRRKALTYALATHAVWGSMPLYLLLVDRVPALEYVAWRTLFTLPICLFFVLRLRQTGVLARTLRDWRTMRTLCASAALIAINWYFYVWAIQTEHVYAASLGYYILPLTMMLLGFVFLGERLSRWQALAVGLAVLGVAALSLGALSTMWVSLLLATTFGVYGLLRKTVNAGPLIGLTVESILLLPLVIGFLGWTELRGEGLAIGRDTIETLAIIAGGPMTAVPLIMFATAARALPYTIIGFLQFISPTIVFLLGLTVFGEVLVPAQLACFVLIWLAVAVFSWDLLRRSQRAKSVAVA